jgi:hypothetical protein
MKTYALDIPTKINIAADKAAILNGLRYKKIHCMERKIILKGC